jgi:hypothetical protein
MSELAYLLPPLLCPVGMGVMMWWMTRAIRSGEQRPPDEAITPRPPMPDRERGIERKPRGASPHD